MYSKFMIDKRNHKKTKTSRSFSACKNYNTNNSNVRTDDPNFFNELRRIRHKVHMRMKLKCHTSGIPTKRDVESEFKLNPYFANKSSIQSATANPDIKINQRFIMRNRVSNKKSTTLYNEIKNPFKMKESFITKKLQRIKTRPNSKIILAKMNLVSQIDIKEFKPKYAEYKVFPKRSISQLKKDAIQLMVIFEQIIEIHTG